MRKRPIQSFRPSILLLEGRRLLAACIAPPEVAPGPPPACDTAAYAGDDGSGDVDAWGQRREPTHHPT